MTESEKDVAKVLAKAILENRTLDGYWYCEACGVLHANDEDCYD